MPLLPVREFAGRSRSLRGSSSDTSATEKDRVRGAESSGEDEFLGVQGGRLESVGGLVHTAAPLTPPSRLVLPVAAERAHVAAGIARHGGRWATATGRRASMV